MKNFTEYVAKHKMKHPQSPEGWKSKAKKPLPTPPKGERAKLLGVKSEE